MNIISILQIFLTFKSGTKHVCPAPSPKDVSLEADLFFHILHIILHRTLYGFLYLRLVGFLRLFACFLRLIVRIAVAGDDEQFLSLCECFRIPRI